ncbi:MAG: hypothetical protein AAGA48_31115 [Myxococcota bacterium]
MAKRHLQDLSQYLTEQEAEEVDTVLMSGSGAEDVFDDLRQRYERRVESTEHRLLDGQPADQARARGMEDSTLSEASIEPPTPPLAEESEVPWYAWLLVVASFVMLLATASAVLLLMW